MIEYAILFLSSLTALCMVVLMSLLCLFQFGLNSRLPH